MFEKKKSVLLFLLPGLCMLLIFYIIPFFSGIGYSLMDGSYKNEFVGLKNYREIWQNSMFLLGLKNTMELSLICAPLLWLFSFLLASALSAIKPFGGFFRSSVLMPYLTPSSAILLVWLVIFDYGGPVNRALEAMGMARVMWLTSGALRLPVVLYYLDGLTVAETAQTLGVPVGTVKFRLHQARKKLRVELDAPEGEGANVQ